MNHTYNREFFNIDETKVYINLMFLRGTLLNYYENDDLKAVKLDYDIKDNSINAIAILPKNEDSLEKNMNELIENLNDELFYKIVNKLNEENSKTKVNFYLPKFEIENDFNISEILKSLGMVEAFKKEADFNGISTKLRLFINQVLQKNYINVNEDGTQAYSITELEIMLESYLTKDENAKDFIANRPFLFILRNAQCPKGHDIIFFTKVCKFNKLYND
jgi:serpin B